MKRSRIKRTISVVTTARSDYGIYRPVLREILKRRELCLRLIVAADHLSARGGMTVREIEADGFPVSDRIPMQPASDTAAGIAGAMARGLAGFAKAYQTHRPDILLVLGDRFEMYTAVAAAMPFGIPVAHLHGGELTEGAMDNQFRHSISKMSHIHFAATTGSGRRLLQMGEESWRVTVTGAPSLDNLSEVSLMSRSRLESEAGMSLDPPPLLVTFHPVTLEPGKAECHTLELLAALDLAGLPVLFTYPNIDMESCVIIRAVRHFVKSHPACRLVKNLGTSRYFSMMKYAAAMVGNSSSGIIEAASFGLPVVNVGNRQLGRAHGRNVVDVPCDRTHIAKAISKVTSPAFRQKIKRLQNPYGNGHASVEIVRILLTIPLGHSLIAKRFNDLGGVRRR